MNADDSARIRALPWNIGFGLLTSSIFGYWTFFGSVFLLYLQELGLPKGQIGMLLSILPFCGLMAPLVASALARWGAKRVCLATYGVRSLVAGLLLLLPLALEVAGRRGGVIFLVGVLLLFAVLRALAETAKLPWSQYYVPNRVRGKYEAVNNVCSTVVSVAALALAGYVVGHGTGLGRFLGLQAAGCAAGLVGTLMLLRVPGGEPAGMEENGRTHWADLREAMRDRNFRNFLCGIAGVMLGSGMLGAFMPLMLVDKVGIGPGTVIWLDNAGLIGGMATVYLWGWMADRYGSRTVLLPGLAASLLLSVTWCAILCTGHTSALRIPHLVLLGAMTGMAGGAVGMGSGRLLLSGVVPPDRSVAYTGIYYAWCGLISGLAPLLAGGILSLKPSASGAAFADPYAVLFLISLVPSVMAWVFFSRTRPDSTTRTRDLLGRLAGQLLNVTQPTFWALNIQRRWPADESDGRRSDRGITKGREDGQ